MMKFVKVLKTWGYNRWVQELIGELRRCT